MSRRRIVACSYKRADCDPTPNLYFDNGTVVGQYEGKSIRGDTVCVFCALDSREQQRELLNRCIKPMSDAGRQFVDFTLRRRNSKSFGHALAFHIYYLAQTPRLTTRSPRARSSHSLPTRPLPHYPLLASSSRNQSYNEVYKTRSQ